MEELRWYNESDHAAMMAEMKTSLGLTFNRHFLFFINKEITSDADWEYTGFIQLNLYFSWLQVERMDQLDFMH